jgi:monoamine oxidase
VPARFLNSINWIPALKEAKRLAARDLQYARIMKTVLLSKNRFWEKALGRKFSCLTDGTSDFVFAASLGQSGEEGILCSYAIGDKADDLAARGAEDLGTLIAADLAKLFLEKTPSRSRSTGMPGRRINILKELTLFIAQANGFRSGQL